MTASDPDPSSPEPPDAADAESDPASDVGRRRSDPLRGSKTSGTWLAVVVLVVLLAFLAIFVLQNTQSVEVSFLGWTGNPPLAGALLVSVGAGALIVVAAGSLRILQLRRRVRRERKQ